MKILFMTNSWKLRFRRLSRLRLFERARRMKQLKKTKRHKQGENRNTRSNRTLWQQAYKVAAPSHFSFVNNTGEMNDFLATLITHRRRERVVGIDASRITSFTPDAITVLLATLEANRPPSKSRLTAKLPFDPDLREQWRSTSFEKYSRTGLVQDYIDEDNRIECVGKEANMNISKATIGALSKLVGRDVALGSIEQKSTLLIVEALKDLVINVYQHAGRPEGSCKWWLSVSPRLETETLWFCLVDAGVGVLRSERVSRWKSIELPRLIEKFSLEITSDCVILQKAVSGEIMFTETHEKHRGQGLQSIKRLVNEKSVTKMYVITNEVWGDVVNDSFVSVPHETRGTVYVFETRPRFWSPTSE